MNIFEALKQEHTKPDQVKDIEDWEKYLHRIFKNEDLEKMYDVQKPYCDKIKEAWRYRFSEERGKFVKTMCSVQKEQANDNVL